MKQPEALQLAETFKQPEMLYTHLLIENATNNGYEPRIHLGCDEKSIVERAYDEGETSNQIFTWHSDEKFKRLHEANQAMLEALKSVWLWMENQADNQSKGGHATFDLMMLREERDKARAAIAKGEQP